MINEPIDGLARSGPGFSDGTPGARRVASLVILRRALQELPSDQPHVHPGNMLILPDRVVLTDIATYQGVLLGGLRRIVKV